MSQSPPALPSRLWEWEECVAQSERPCQHPVDCTIEQTRVSHRHGEPAERGRCALLRVLAQAPVDSQPSMIQGLHIGSMKV